MSLARYAKRRDANQSDIVKALEQVGAEVWVIDRPCDLIVWYRRVWHLLETKTARGKLTPKQKEDREQGRAEGIRIVRSPQEALKVVGAIT